MNMETLQFPYGDGRIVFRLERRDRNTLVISVTPDAKVEVIAPIDAPLEKVFEKVRKRAPWIQRQQRFFKQFQPRRLKRQYISGETHLYLGRQYKLKVVPHIQQQVKLYRGRLIVQSLKPKKREVTKALVEQWYHQRAQATFRERLALCKRRFLKPEDFEPTGLVIMQLRQRWG
jgi:predicted metal-dependent hydrolase